MKAVHFNVNFFFLLLSGVGIMMFFILQPFLTAILAAAILAALFQGWYGAFLRVTGNRPHVSAALTSLSIALIVLVPLFAVLSIALNEMNYAYDNIASDGSSMQNVLSGVSVKLQSIPLMHVFISDQSFDATHILNTVKGFSQNIFSFIQALYENIAHLVFWLLVMFFSLFYFLVDGKAMVRYFMKVTPLRDEHEKLLIDKFVYMSRATLKGTLMVGMVQGFLGGMMFAIAGLPSPVIWGLVMTVLSAIPLVGGGLVWLPAGIILLLMGQVWQGTFILLFGMIVISTIDNVLRPKLVGRDTQMHPLMIFFATLGGISFFGFPGFVIGPIIASLALALLDIYVLEFKTQLKSYNE
jgi:predicted PurR-regulated permease PerM